MKLLDKWRKKQIFKTVQEQIGVDNMGNPETRDALIDERMRTIDENYNRRNSAISAIRKELLALRRIDIGPDAYEVRNEALAGLETALVKNEKFHDEVYTNLQSAKHMNLDSSTDLVSDEEKQVLATNAGLKKMFKQGRDLEYGVYETGIEIKRFLGICEKKIVGLVDAVEAGKVSAHDAVANYLNIKQTEKTTNE